MGLRFKISRYIIHKSNICGFQYEIREDIYINSYFRIFHRFFFHVSIDIPNIYQYFIDFSIFTIIK